MALQPGTVNAQRLNPCWWLELFSLARYGGNSILTFFILLIRAVCDIPSSLAVFLMVPDFFRPLTMMSFS